MQVWAEKFEIEKADTADALSFITDKWEAA